MQSTRKARITSVTTTITPKQDYNQIAMHRIRIAAAFVPLLFASGADLPLPGLTVEATDGGSVLRIRNGASQPLTAYLIELVGYPGSSFALYQEVSGQAIAPGEERRVPIVNMTVGAAPEYVKMQAALYSDGASAGSADKMAQLIGLRRTTLETTRELITRLEDGKRGDKAAVAAGLRGWAESIPAPTKRDRGTPAALSRSTARDLILACAVRLDRSSVEDVLASLRASERALAASRPPL
jgi:hypothetical protein